MAEVATAKKNAETAVSGVAAGQLSVLNAQKDLIDAQTGLACSQMAEKAPGLVNAGMELKLPKVCDKYLTKAKKEETAK